MTKLDKDDAPELTVELAKSARRLEDLPELAKIVRRGRPKVETPKVPMSIRVDARTLAHFKKEGKGWQTRINKVLNDAAGV